MCKSHWIHQSFVINWPISRDHHGAQRLPPWAQSRCFQQLHCGWHPSDTPHIPLYWNNVGVVRQSMFPTLISCSLHWRCPTVIVAAPGRAWLYNCNHIQLNFQFGPLLIRPVIREADAEHFLQRPVKGAVSEDHCWGKCFSVSRRLGFNYKVVVSSVTQKVTHHYLRASTDCWRKLSSLFSPLFV